MAFIAWQASAVDDDGNVISGAQITVINETTGLEETLYSDKAGTPLSNPFNADADGFFQFYVAAGVYRITALDLSTSLQRQWDNVVINPPVGTEADELPVNGDFGSASKVPIGIAGGHYCTVGGTANAITLTTGVGLTSLTTGMQFRFKASAQNTGAVTIAVDGLTPEAGKTITDVACPSDYIRNDGVETVITYNGTDFTIDRVIERGSNSDGDWVRWADGSQECFVRTIECAYQSTSVLRVTWNHPKAFLVAPLVNPSDADAGANMAPNVSEVTSPYYRSDSGASTASASLIDITRFSGSSAFTVSDYRLIGIVAKGFWY